MGRGKFLKKALKHFDGFDFEDSVLDQLAKDENSILKPLLPTTTKANPEEAMSMIQGRVNLAFLICVRNEDFYRRVRGDGAFYYLILADWNSEHQAAPFPPASIEKLINVFVVARRTHLVAESEVSRLLQLKGNMTKFIWLQAPAENKLTSVVDRFIKIIDDVDSSIATRSVSSLKAPQGFDMGSTWPPVHFSPVDVAIMGEPTVRKALYGINHVSNGGAEKALIYPNDQHPPLDVRKYLCWLSLRETKPDSDVALFLAPIAFAGDQQRREWYKPTGHKSRYYAIIEEFLVYARGEFKKTGKEEKQHVMGLLTPWFFDVNMVNAKALEKNEAIPLVWQKSCFRAGIMICLTKLKRDGPMWSCRLVLFRPGLPNYEKAAEPSDRRPKQNVWVEHLLKELGKHFVIIKGWIGGRAKHHVPAPPERKVSADSVEVSCEIITEIMERPDTLPSERLEFLNRGFTALEQYK
ncbi:uncharacterized protein F4822DRAFT_401526 [Hypoxylon trugodes]|uniref:uncharacterized protein n=1 Tax=Hypoxylon trugodes TaxID=326681 RepID=UPI002190E294|nr:uncharacterized protein F4822DRAFT_401526 [Hypoxylon trugodes]KAI1390313.1 hypothetical protein F4822DRAFT_401526 [Hypoxylon trugodes]